VMCGIQNIGMQDQQQSSRLTLLGFWPRIAPIPK
jgi:hypothetical protein